MTYKILIDSKKDSWACVLSQDVCLHFVGSPFFDGEMLSSYESVLLEFSKCDLNNLSVVSDFLKRFDGLYGFVFENRDSVLVVTDRVKSFSFFYSVKDKNIVLSNRAHLVKQEMSLDKQNTEGVIEFLVSGFCWGNRTLYDGLLQLPPACFLLYDKATFKCGEYSYYDYLPNTKKTLSRNEIEKSTESDLVSEFEDMLYKSFKRLKTFLDRKGLRPVVPLSGGVDSRLMVIMLHEVGVSSVLCFTYGSETESEVDTSRKMAKKMGMEWEFIPYSKNKWSDEYNSFQMTNFLEYSGELSINPHIQDYIAVKELVKKYSNHLMFLPGHSLDYLAGSHIPADLYRSLTVSLNDLAYAIIRKHFRHHCLYSADRKTIRNVILEVLSTYSMDSKSEMLAALENIDWKERQSKLIINSLNVYRFFGCSCYVPFWEKEFFDFFAKLPYNQKIGRCFCLRALHVLFPKHYSEVKPVTEHISITQTLLLKLKSFFSTTASIDLWARRLSNNTYKSLICDAGLSRFGSFDVESKSTDEFARKMASKTDVRTVLYLYHVDYLKKMGVNLSSVNASYLK